MDRDQPPSQVILFADIADSTRMYDRLGDSVAKHLVAVTTDIMTAVVRANTGRVIKTIGDGVMARFPSADSAAAAAVQMHETIAADQCLKTNDLRLRIGFHYGPVIEEESDLYGDAVNVAARMTALAKAGQIITSRRTFQMLNPKHCTTARMVDQTRVKGKKQVMEIYEITWGRQEELTILKEATRDMATPVPQQHTVMTLEIQGRYVSIDPEHPVATLGRHESNQLVINGAEVSRLHARVELRKDKFILIDRSTNGTYVYPMGFKMLYLRRDEIPLEGRGFLSLGQEVGSESPMAIHYLCF